MLRDRGSRLYEVLRQVRPLVLNSARAVEASLKPLGLTVGTGVFAADMKVGLINDGPATFILDSAAVIILLTANPSPGLDMAEAVGIDIVLSKPVEPLLVSGMIDHVRARRQRRLQKL